MFRRLLLFAVVVACCVTGRTGRGADTLARDESFERDVAPILQTHCVECHGDDEPEAELRLTSRDALLYGSRSGRVAVPGQAEASMFLRLLAPDAKPHMPPDGQLTAAEIAVLAKWMNGLTAATLPERKPVAALDHWAYAPLTSPAPPAVKNAGWIRDPLDRFVSAKLEAVGLAPSPETDPATLCRRIHFDLVGLPPTPERLQTFVADPSDAAYRKLVDELLASPRYGERWGRHWLDLARYADSSGYHEDIDRPYAWKYRDYVIASFNADKPYARFIAEQLAGDEIAPNDSVSWIATGFCRCGPSNDSNMGDGPLREKYRLDLLDDVLSTASSAFLGQTIGCARCHDHKLDPITQAEYYRFLALFDTTERVDVVVDEHGRPAATHTMDQQAKLKKSKERPEWSIMALTDAGAKPRATRILWRGDVKNVGPEVAPGVPAALAREQLTLPTTAADAKTTGRRRALAEWIASPRNPLTWRVVVNRIWQHHFGAGIVATPSNFGRSGAAPTHPELLDYLAQEMIDGGGSWKTLHRRIVTSATYRRSATASAEAVARARTVDPENRLMWRSRRHRLEAEALRDSILAVAGTLNEQVGGPGIKPRIRPELLDASQRNKWPVVKQEGPEHRRRSVYIYVKRQLPFPMLELFDQPNTSQTCERRDENVIPTQALVLMNDEFVADQAAKFADRTRNAAASDVPEQVRQAIRIALGREASTEEVAETVEYLAGRTAFYRGERRSAADAERAALIDFCHVLFNSNEFAYVD